MVLNCPHCANSASYMTCDFGGQWVICRKCETPFRWREADTAWAASSTEPSRVGATEKEMERSVYGIRYRNFNRPS